MLDQQPADSLTCTPQGLPARWACLSPGGFAHGTNLSLPITMQAPRGRALGSPAPQSWLQPCWPTQECSVCWNMVSPCRMGPGGWKP